MPGRRLNRLIVLTAILLAQSCESMKHYCSKEQQLEVDSDKHSPTQPLIDETLIPRFSEITNDVDLVECDFKLRFDSGKIGLMVLQAVLDHDDAKEANWKLNHTAEVKFGWQTARTLVTAATFHVYPFIAGQPFLIRSYWNPRTHRRSKFNLRFLLPFPNNCGSGMLSHRGRCFIIVGNVEQTATEALSSIGGYAQLATFDSRDEIDEFLAAAKDSDLRKDLSNMREIRIRIGLFYSDRQDDTAVLKAVRNSSGGCVWRQVDQPDDFRPYNKPEGHCAALRLAPDFSRPVVEFIDCNSSLLSLLSFGDTSQLGSGEAAREAMMSSSTCDLDLSQLRRQRLQQQQERKEDSPVVRIVSASRAHRFSNSNWPLLLLLTWEATITVSVAMLLNLD